MTPEERAAAIISRSAAGHFGWQDQQKLIAAAIREALAERDARWERAVGMNLERAENLAAGD